MVVLNLTKQLFIQYDPATPTSKYIAVVSGLDYFRCWHRVANMRHSIFKCTALLNYRGYHLIGCIHQASVSGIV